MEQTPDGPLQPPASSRRAQRRRVQRAGRPRSRRCTRAEGDQWRPASRCWSWTTACCARAWPRSRPPWPRPQAQLALLQAGARPEETARPKRCVAQAEAAATAAHQTWDDAQAAARQPQELDLAIIEAETALAKASHRPRLPAWRPKPPTCNVTCGAASPSCWQRASTCILPSGGAIHVDNPAEREQANAQWNVASQQAWEAWQTAYAADDAVQRRQHRPGQPAPRHARCPSPRMPACNQAEAAYRQAEACRRTGARGLAGAAGRRRRPSRSRLARQTVEQARAARAALDVQVAKTRITAPCAGLVSAAAVHEGEVARARRAPAGDRRPERSHADRVRAAAGAGPCAAGPTRQVPSNSFPGRVFHGKVTRIADQAEFTPKNVQTQEERVNTVFAVKITLPNPDGALKPGMPADAEFAEEMP